MTTHPQHTFILAAFIGSRTYLEVLPSFEFFFRDSPKKTSLQANYNFVSNLATFTVTSDGHIDDVSVKRFKDLVQNFVGAGTYTFRNDDGTSPQIFSLQILNIQRDDRASVIQSVKEYLSLWLLSSESFGFTVNYFGRDYVRLAIFSSTPLNPKMVIGLDGLLEQYRTVFSLKS